MVFCHEIDNCRPYCVCVLHSVHYNVYFLKLLRVDLVACTNIMKEPYLQRTLSALAEFIDMANHIFSCLILVLRKCVCDESCK